MKLRAENPKVYAGREMDFDTNKMQPKCVILLLE